MTSVKKNQYNSIIDDFNAKIIIESPGRINLIGEHIDYNGGHVLPAAIDKTIKLYLKKSETNDCHIQSLNFDTAFQFDINHLTQSEQEWENYILGTTYFINQIKPNQLSGFDCLIVSDLPIGAGLSSSASLECGLAKGLDLLFNLNLSDDEIISCSMKAEHQFVGTQCGIMDQFAVTMGKKNQAILLNCQDKSFNYISLIFDQFEILLLNTNVTHQLSTSGYNDRQNDCINGLNIIQKTHPNFEFLADVPTSLIQTMRQELGGQIFNRALFVSEENSRTLSAAKALKNNNLNLFGELMYQSHEGLQNLYEVSCPELDFMVEFSKNYPDIFGSRMMGGGFGGCTINLIKKGAVSSYIEDISNAYFAKFSKHLTPIRANIYNGVSKIN